MTINDDLYCKIGRMTVAFGNLDFMVGLAAGHMAERLGEDRVPKFTQQKLRAMKDWSKAHAQVVGADLSAEIVTFANDAGALLRRRPDGAHGMWLQEGDVSTAWAMRLPDGDTKGVRSSTDAETVDRLTQDAAELNLRVGQLAVRLLKSMDA